MTSEDMLVTARPETGDDEVVGLVTEDEMRTDEEPRLKPSTSVPSLEIVNRPESVMEVDTPCIEERKAASLGLVRSKTMPTRPLKKVSSVKLDRMKNARLLVDRAIKQQKIFTIQGPYGTVRRSLRKRGWVEKFYKTSAAATVTTPRAKKMDSENEDDDDDDDLGSDDDADDFEGEEEKIPVWEEEDGFYAIMSRCLKNIDPSLIWSVRRDAFDPRLLKKEQIINHYAKVAFTTKVGLCLNMRNVPWFEQADPDAFFPRCYRLSHDEEKQNFMDDFRMTACMSLLKCIKKQHWACYCRKGSLDSEDKMVEDSVLGCDADKTEVSRAEKADLLVEESAENQPEDASVHPNAHGKSHRKGCVKKKKKKGGVVHIWALDVAMLQCEKYLKAAVHADIDTMQDEYSLSEQHWNTFIQEYYKVVHDEATISGVCERMADIDVLIEDMRKKWPQFDLDGIKNVWIVKPGAQSRGRGIICYDRLETMLKLVCSQVATKDGKYVVQKYIERPLLIYQTKFDIRQWFLVTDWNPLTIWFYKDCYLRFCSQLFTLDDFDSAIHLSNNSIQKSYANGLRASSLPADNMWSVGTFKEYLKERGLDKTWDDTVYPGMKKSIVCALLCSQDFVEYRKSAFALYGADFMLTENFKPWLIEINCSPSMSFSTKVTAKLCANVMEDTLKVVIDRRLDRNCDIGQFELAYKQVQVAVPPYIGMSLVVEGQNIPKPVCRRVHDIAVKPAVVTNSAPVLSAGKVKGKRARSKRRVWSVKCEEKDSSDAEERIQVKSVSSSVAAVTSEQADEKPEAVIDCTEHVMDSLPAVVQPYVTDGDREGADQEVSWSADSNRECLRRPVVDAMKASSLMMLRASPFKSAPSPVLNTASLASSEHRHQERPNCTLRRIAPLQQYNMTIFNDRVKGTESALAHPCRVRTPTDGKPLPVAHVMTPPTERERAWGSMRADTCRCHANSMWSTRLGWRRQHRAYSPRRLGSVGQPVACCVQTTALNTARATTQTPELHSHIIYRYLLDSNRSPNSPLPPERCRQANSRLIFFNRRLCKLKQKFHKQKYV